MNTEAALADLDRARTIADLHRVLVDHAILGPEPRFLQFEFDITSKCNLRCRMCYFSLDEVFFAPPVYLEPRHLDALMPWMNLAHTVTLSLGNEPMSSPHFVEILRRLDGHGVPNVTFYTNGTLLSPRTIAAILECGVTQVCVSMDGATRETFEYVRRGARFDQVIAGVLALMDARRAAGRRHPHVRMNVVAMRRNLEELVALVDLAATVGMTDINFTHVVPYTGLGMDEQSLSLVPEAWNRVRIEILERARTVRLPIAAVPEPFPLDTVTPGEPAVAPVPMPHPYCLYPFFHVSMDAGGHVLACPFAHGAPAYGRLSAESSLEQVWFNEAFRALRRAIVADQPPDMCRRCSFLANRYPASRERFAPRPWTEGAR